LERDDIASSAILKSVILRSGAKRGVSKDDGH
jgi:hypothetical protein